MKLDKTSQRILDTHNAERAAVGVPPLRWNEELAQHAADYAQVLARTGQLVHSPREGRGAERENLQKGLIGWSPERMVGDWLKEKANFVPGNFPDVARDGNWLNVAHYTQIIWPTTTDVGCGQAQGGGFTWFVCRYTPGGNKDGKSVGLPPAPGQSEIAADYLPTSDSVSRLLDEFARDAGLSSYRRINYYSTRVSLDDYWEGTLGASYILNANARFVGSYFFRTQDIYVGAIGDDQLFSIVTDFRYDADAPGAKASPGPERPTTFEPADAPYSPGEQASEPDPM